MNEQIEGFTALKQVLVTGQYHNPKGLWYGGSKLQASHVQLLELLRRRFTTHSHCFLVDVHTGLGPSGVDTLIAEGGTAIQAFMKRTFGAESGEAEYPFLHGSTGAFGGSTDKTGAGSGYSDAQGFSANYLLAMNWSHVAAVTQEFGTVPGLRVVHALARENAVWHHSNDTAARSAAARAARDVFYVRTANWQRSIVRRGVAVVKQALAALESDSAAMPQGMSSQ